MPFQAHIELLQLFLTRRDDIVENVQGVLNAQRKPSGYLQNAALLSRVFEDCCFAAAGVTVDQSRLRGQLEEAHWAGGFKPRAMAGLHNGLADPGEMMVRGFHLWQQTRWPGRNGRVRYAQTLFNLSLLQRLTLLTMRLWDDGPGEAGARLSQVQRVLDQLWHGTPAGQPVLVRDARWLIPLAQSPATDDLGPYFGVAEQVAQSFSTQDRLAIHDAGVRLAAGHLRSQIRYYCLKNAAGLDDARVVLNTRNSNALDFALLIQDLVPLLEAYEQACRQKDEPTRVACARTICQGISPDPELFLNRVDLLGAYSIIEPLFVTTDADGHAAYTPMGRRHVALVKEYKTRIGRVAMALSEDYPRFRPVTGAYSPYGLLYGFSSNLLEHIVLRASLPDGVAPFTLEDVFVEGDGAKLAWVNGWRKLPHLTPEVQAQFDYPRQFADDVFARIEAAFGAATSRDGARAFKTGCLSLAPHGDRPALPGRYIRPFTTNDRREGKYLVSYETAAGSVGISKDVLTGVLGAGQDAAVSGLPPAAAEILVLACPTLVAQA
jgi:hypothetical protein